MVKKKFVTTDTLKDICEYLQLWPKITKFMLIEKVEDVREYNEKLSGWIDLLKKFYVVGGRTFITKNPNHPGDDETFYLYCLRYYMPQIAKKTVDDFGLGLGIYTMQDFERRNKESKYTFRRFNNYKGNVLLPNMRRLWDKFEHSITD